MHLSQTTSLKFRDLKTTSPQVYIRQYGTYYDMLPTSSFKIEGLIPQATQSAVGVQPSATSLLWDFLSVREQPCAKPCFLLGWTASNK